MCYCGCKYENYNGDCKAGKPYPCETEIEEDIEEEVVYKTHEAK